MDDCIGVLHGCVCSRKLCSLERTFAVIRSLLGGSPGENFWDTVGEHHA